MLCTAITQRIVCVHVYFVIVCCIFRSWVDCGNCPDIVPLLDSFGREIRLPRSLTNGTTVYNMTFSDTLGSTINVKLRNNHHDFKIKKLTTYRWYLETINACISVTESWNAEFLITIDSYMCLPQFVLFIVEPVAPDFLLPVNELTLDLGDCKPGRILDVYNISEAITNADHCVSFKCGIKPDTLFWVENDTIIRTLTDDIVYGNTYELDVCCAEKGVDQAFCHATNITLFVNKTAACYGLLTTDPTVSTDISTKVCTCNTARSEGIKGNSECFFDRSASMAAVFSLVGNLIGAATVVVVYLLSHRVCKNRSENTRISGGGNAS